MGMLSRASYNLKTVHICVQPVIQALLVEPSEEVRLQLVQFMRSLLKQAPRLIQAFASDVASILVAATFDSHPDVLLVRNIVNSITVVFYQCFGLLFGSLWTCCYFCENCYHMCVLIALKGISGGISSIGVIRRDNGI